MADTRKLHDYIVEVGNEFTVYDDVRVSAADAAGAAREAVGSGKWKGAFVHEIFRSMKSPLEFLSFNVTLYDNDQQDEAQVRIVPPTVNMNGATADSLLEQQEAVLEAVTALQKALAAAAPHGRDFQYDRTGLELPKAQEDHRKELMYLSQIGTRHRELAIAIYDQKRK
jgi:hypothetical protein